MRKLEFLLLTVTLHVGLTRAQTYQVTPVSFNQVSIDDSFWKPEKWRYGRSLMNNFYG